MSIDVTEGGDVTNVIARVSGAVVAISKRYRVDGAGRWGGAARVPGLHACIHGALGSSDAEGCLEVDLVVGGSTRTGRVAWRARRVCGLPHALPRC